MLSLIQCIHRRWLSKQTGKILRRRVTESAWLVGTVHSLWPSSGPSSKQTFRFYTFTLHFKLPKILYALPDFSRQLTVDDRHRTGAISRKAWGHGVPVPHIDFDIDQIIDSVNRSPQTPRLPNLDIVYIITSLQDFHNTLQSSEKTALPPVRPTSTQVEYSQYKTVLSLRRLINFRWL